MNGGARAGAGAPAGNRNAAKAKRWERALRKALTDVGDGSLDAGLDKVATVVVAAAIAGEREAWTEIANRLDGKPTEHVRLDEEVTVLLDDSAELRGRLDRILERRTRHTTQ